MNFGLNKLKEMLGNKDLKREELEEFLESYDKTFQDFKILPFYFAIENPRKEIIEFLVERYKDKLNEKDGNGKRSFENAFHNPRFPFDSLKRLLENKCKIDKMKIIYGDSFLQNLIEKQLISKKLLKLFVENKINFSITNFNQSNLFHHLSDYRKEDLPSILLFLHKQKLDLFSTDFFLRSPLHYAAHQRNHVLIKFILLKGFSPLQTDFFVKYFIL